MLSIILIRKLVYHFVASYQVGVIVSYLTKVIVL